MWNNQVGRWCLVQVYPKPEMLLKIIATQHIDKDHEYETPTLENTVQWLYEASPAHKRNKWALDRWLGKVDEDVEKAGESRSKAAMDRIEEGVDRLWHAISNRTVITKSDGRTTQRPKTG